ncbi:GNAT family N-acetyltransferase [Arthrobacter cupressi]
MTAVPTATELEIRVAGPEDFAEIRRVTIGAYLAAGHVTEGHPYLAVLGDVEQRARHAELWIAELGGRAVASVMITHPGRKYTEVALDGELEFRMLAVDPAAQGLGVGRAIVERILDHAHSLDGVEAVAITSGAWMAPAHRLYGSLGFVRVPERDWSFDGGPKDLWVFRHGLR